MKNKNILISGAGIAGLTLAYWLKKYGFNPTIIEKSSNLREGGYVIDFFGAGYEVAEKMNILSKLEKVDIKIPEIMFVNERNQRIAGLNTFKIRHMLNNRAFSLLRSDLAKVIYSSLDSKVEILLSTSIKTIDNNPENVKVIFNSGEEQVFDLLIGADGLHSNVRALIFGKETNFEKFYGYYTASFTIDNYLEDKNVFLSYTCPEKQVGIYSLKENKLAAFFLIRIPKKIVYDYHSIAQQQELLFSLFKNVKWECPSLLEKMNSSSDFYFDSVSQIQMTEWSKERVSLVGDACDCPSLLSGQGSTLAMVGAYILAGELKESEGDYRKAFHEYQKEFKPFIDKKQRIAQKFASSFVPKNEFGIWVRNIFTKIMFFPILSTLFFKPFMTDNLKLKKY
jgi:2-polyprenyl-6-methoxyphenol hydroxylase-like FAD-dependent oxidoreductase